MERAVREMTFDEEYEILKQEFEKIIEEEDEHSEPSFKNCVLRRAMQCIRKQGEELKAYKDLEEQGLLHKAPFKIGQPIWIVGNELINDYVIRRFIVTEDGIEAVKISKEINGKEYWNTFYIESWLVYVFPTKAEAEKALAEMEK